MTKKFIMSQFTIYFLYTGFRIRNNLRGEKITVISEDHSNITKAMNWVVGFRNQPFLHTNSTQRVDGFENPPKHYYVIFEWFLIGTCIYFSL